MELFKVINMEINAQLNLERVSHNKSINKSTSIILDTNMLYNMERCVNEFSPGKDKVKLLKKYSLYQLLELLTVCTINKTPIAVDFAPLAYEMTKRQQSICLKKIKSFEDIFGLHWGISPASFNGDDIGISLLSKDSPLLNIYTANFNTLMLVQIIIKNSYNLNIYQKIEIFVSLSRKYIGLIASRTLIVAIILFHQVLSLNNKDKEIYKVVRKNFEPKTTNDKMIKSAKNGACDVLILDIASIIELHTGEDIWIATCDKKLAYIYTNLCQTIGIQGETLFSVSPMYDIAIEYALGLMRKTNALEKNDIIQISSNEYIARVTKDVIECFQ